MRLNLSLPTQVEFAGLLTLLALPDIHLPGPLPLVARVQLFARSPIPAVAFAQQPRVAFDVLKP